MTDPVFILSVKNLMKIKLTISYSQDSSIENVDGDRGRLGRGWLAGVEAGVAVLDAADDESRHESSERISKQKVSFRSF
jgi:hypothetical protein